MVCPTRATASTLYRRIRRKPREGNGCGPGIGVSRAGLLEDRCYTMHHRRVASNQGAFRLIFPPFKEKGELYNKELRKT